MMRKKNKPFWKDDEGKLHVRWDKVWSWQSWKIPFRDFLLIIIVIGMTISYIHDTKVCREFNADPCEFIRVIEDACYEPNTCVRVDWSNPYGFRLPNISFNGTGGG